MRIESLAVVFPERRVTNEDVVAEVAELSTAFKGNLDGTLNYIRRALRITGSDTRYWINGSGESPLSLTVDCCLKAMDKIGRGQKIDMLICASVYRFVLEPSSANVIADALGLYNVESTDITAACDGWMKAVKFAQALMKSEPNTYKRILIVNPEFSMTPNYAIRHSEKDLFKLTSSDELSWRFPVFTVGEGVTATIVEQDGELWKFTNSTRNDLYPLCSVATPWHADGQLADKVGMDGPGRFTSWAAELSKHGIQEAISLYKSSDMSPNAEILFTHASSTKDWRMIAKEIGMGNKWYDIHPMTGNLVSGSIPAAMALAEQHGSLTRGTNVAILCASAGMTFSTASLEY